MLKKNYLWFLFLFFICCKNGNNKDILTCTVKNGIFDIEVVETGEIQAIKAINISSPPMNWRYGMQKITMIVEDGKEVKMGDTVITFDPSEVNKSIINSQAELEIAQAELDKLKAEQEMKIEELEADLKIATINHRISEIELELSSYESEIRKKEIQLDLDKAKIQLNKAKDEIENQKKIHHEEVNQQNLKLNQLKNNLQEDTRTRTSLQVISPSDGVAIIRNNWSTDNKWQVGDQVWSGNALIDLPDLSRLKVLTNISEIDVSKIKIGQKVEIRLDAFSDSIYYGSVTSIASLAKNKDEKKQKVKVFPVEIYVSKSSKLLMPGMTVTTKIEIDKIKDVLFTPIESVFKEVGKDYVFIKRNRGFKKIEVETGLTNNDYIIITKGVKKGDVLALSDPFKKKEEDNENKK